MTVSPPIWGQSRVLVTGGAGTVGSALTRHLLSLGATVCALDHDEDGLFRLRGEFPDEQRRNLRLFLGDVNEPDRVATAIKDVNYVFHCAALKHVELSEYNPRECYRTNIEGTWNVVRAAVDEGVRSVVVTSSDKAVHPTGVMGASKLLAERLAIASNLSSGRSQTRVCCVRFGNIIDSRGSVLTVFRRQRERGEPLTVTDPSMTRFFISLEQARDLCMEAAAITEGGELFVRNMGSASIQHLVDAFMATEQLDTRVIGTFPGEKAYEELLTAGEALRARSLEGLIVVLPEWAADAEQAHWRDFAKYTSGATMDGPLTSGAVTMSRSDIEALIPKGDLDE